MQTHDTEVMKEATKRFAAQCFEAKGSIEKAMEPFGFPFNPHPEAYDFDASIEVHPVRKLYKGHKHHWYQGDPRMPDDTNTFLLIYGIRVDGSSKFLYEMKVRTK